MLIFTDGWNLRPPLYGPRELLNWTRYPLFTCISPLSSTQETLDLIWRSGSVRHFTTAFFRYFSSLSKNGFIDFKTSFTAWWYSTSPGLKFFTSYISFSVSNIFFTLTCVKVWESIYVIIPQSLKKDTTATSASPHKSYSIQSRPTKHWFFYLAIRLNKIS